MTLPYVVDAETSLSPVELQVLHDQYDAEAASGHITTQTKFNYAWALIKSTQRHQMLQGVALLTDIYRTDPPRRRECLYYLALGHYKLSNFDEAKRFNALLLEREPNNSQAQSLHALIEQGIAKEGYIGMALLGGAVTVTGVVLTALLRRGRRQLDLKGNALGVHFRLAATGKTRSFALARNHVTSRLDTRTAFGAAGSFS